eukprot:UN01123
MLFDECYDTITVMAGDAKDQATSHVESLRATTNGLMQTLQWNNRPCLSTLSQIVYDQVNDCYSFTVTQKFSDKKQSQNGTTDIVEPTEIALTYQELQQLERAEHGREDSDYDNNNNNSNNNDLTKTLPKPQEVITKLVDIPKKIYDEILSLEKNGDGVKREELINKLLQSQKLKSAAQQLTSQLVDLLSVGSDLNKLADAENVHSNNNSPSNNSNTSSSLSSSSLEQQKADLHTEISKIRSLITELTHRVGLDESPTETTTTNVNGQPYKT